MLSGWRFRGASFSVALLSAMACVGTSQATVLVPSTTAPPDVFLAPGGATLLASLLTPWTNSTTTMSGTLDTAVFADPFNAFCAGCLDFMYQVSNSANSTDGIGRVTAINFTGSQTDVGFLLNGSALPGGLFVNGTVAPQLVDRSSAGDTIGFSFTAPLFEPVGAGATSTVLVIETNAKKFAAGNANIIDGGVTTVAAFEPVAAVPEPASWAMMIIGAGAIGSSLRLARRGRGFGERVAA